MKIQLHICGEGIVGAGSRQMTCRMTDDWSRISALHSSMDKHPLLSGKKQQEI